MATEEAKERMKKEHVPSWPYRPGTKARSESFHELDTYLKSLIRTIPDFPKPGMQYQDVTTLLLDPVGFQTAIDAFARRYSSMNITHIVSCESRGFIFGAPVAMALKCAFVPIRRARQLPGQTIGIDYTSGFSTKRLEVHHDAIPVRSRIVIIDDMVLTGKTLQIAYELMTQLGADVVECGCVVDMKEFRKEELIKDLPLFTLLSYE